MSTNKSRFASLTEGLPPTYWLIWTGTLINRLGGFVIPFLTLYLTAQREIPVSQAALVVSLFGAGSFLAQLTGGELTDRLGRRPVMLMSFFITPIFMVILGLERNLLFISVSTFIVGFFTDLYRPAVGAAIADLVPSAARTRAYGYNYWAINLGAAVAPLLAGLIADYNYLILFIADAITTAAFGLIVLFGIRETRPTEAHHSTHATATERMQQLRQEPILLVFSLLALFFGMIYMQGNVTLPLDMQSHGLGPQQYGATIAVNGFLIILVTIPVSNMAARWPRFETIAISAVLLGLGFGFTALASRLPLFMLSVAIWTLGEIAATAVAPAIIADLSPVALRGLYQGIFGSAWGLAFFIGPLSGGWIYEHLGSNTLWLGCLILGIGLAFAYLGMSKPAKRRMERTQLTSSD
ncbi:MAG: MFS transporter [Anaerolineales bacterium]|nr:MFS transporter [Anaerolineae bacterium]PWB70519.1 MAG: MFS transporter [Anaerolineales bacterium]